ncbi:hypothetical protein THRCLA_10527 [Thraustotheca clavata]|uniref:PH domain-containing protein n=1 Tax=Thraustotheca clavata TaxID=74557 RepID=A0A1V9YLK7_9STRA|nr:hypothetical protein THRCLA_10527 [Thraustotheca clavata]
MVQEGYLIRHVGKKAHVCFFRLEDGYLKYYTGLADTLVGELRLSGCRVSVQAHKRSDGIGNTFIVQSQRVQVNDRKYKLSTAERMELTAISGEERSQWGRAIMTWQRRYFENPLETLIPSSEQECTRIALEAIVKAMLKPLRTTNYFNLPMLKLRKSMSFALPLSTKSKTPAVLSFNLPPQPAVTIA